MKAILRFLIYLGIVIFLIVLILPPTSTTKTENQPYETPTSTTKTENQPYETPKSLNLPLRPKAPEITDMQISLLENMISLNVLDLNTHTCEAYIDPIVWESMDYKQKEMVTTLCARYCAKKSNQTADVAFITVFDKQSGKKLAKYDAFEYKVY